MGLPENLARPFRAPGARRYAVALGRLPAYRLGLERGVARRRAQAPGTVQARRRGAENHLPVPDAARRGRRADSVAGGAKMLRRRRLETKDFEDIHPRRGWLSPLPDRQPEHLLGLYVGLARTGVAAGALRRDPRH